MTAETPTRKPPRPKLDEISWHRDMYAEQVQASGFDPLPDPLPSLDWNVVLDWADL